MKTLLCKGFAVIVLLSGIVSMAYAPVANAACGRFLTFPAWYNGLTVGDCEIKPIEKTKNGLRDYAIKIILNIVEMVMQLVGYGALIFLIAGGFRYITAAGAPDQMTAAKKTIANAIIGMVIAIAGVAIVNVVGAVLVLK